MEPQRRINDRVGVPAELLVLGEVALHDRSQKPAEGAGALYGVHAVLEQLRHHSFGIARDRTVVQPVPADEALEGRVGRQANLVPGLLEAQPQSDVRLHVTARTRRGDAYEHPRTLLPRGRTNSGPANENTMHAPALSEDQTDDPAPQAACEQAS